MKLSKRVIRKAVALDEAQDKGVDLNRKQRRLLEAAAKKISK
jgi:hypothetical protein